MPLSLCLSPLSISLLRSLFSWLTDDFKSIFSHFCLRNGKHLFLIGMLFDNVTRFFFYYLFLLVFLFYLFETLPPAVWISCYSAQHMGCWFYQTSDSVMSVLTGVLNLLVLDKMVSLAAIADSFPFVHSFYYCLLLLCVILTLLFKHKTSEQWLVKTGNSCTFHMPASLTLASVTPCVRWLSCQTVSWYKYICSCCIWHLQVL